MYEFMKPPEGFPESSDPQLKVAVEFEDGEEVILDATNTIVCFFGDQRYNHCRYSNPEGTVRGLHVSPDMLKYMRECGFATLLRQEPDGYTTELYEARMAETMPQDLDVDEAISKLLAG